MNTGILNTIRESGLQEIEIRSEHPVLWREHRHYRSITHRIQLFKKSMQ